MSPYLDALLAEITAWGRALGHPPVNTIFFGGGTPSYLPEGALGRIIAAAGQAFSIREDAEITAEANPGDLTPDRAASLLGQGLNRISIGVQSLDNDLLNLLGRRHDADQAIAAFHTVHDGGVRQRQPGSYLRPAPPVPGPVAGYSAAPGRPGTGPYLPLLPDGGGGNSPAPLGGTG